MDFFLVERSGKMLESGGSRGALVGEGMGCVDQIGCDVGYVYFSWL